MSREVFGSWGAALPPDMFAQALAAAGVFYYPWPTRERDSLVYELLRLLDNELPTQWQFPWWLTQERMPDLDADLLASAWRDAAERVRRNRPDSHLRGAVRLNVWVEAAGEAARWIVRELSGAAVGADGVSLNTVLRSAVRWSWPLRVGTLNDPESLRLLSELRSSRYAEDLSSVQPLQAGDACDLLVLPHSLREATMRVLTQVPPVSAGAVAVLGGTLEPWERTGAMVETLREETGAAVAFVATVPERWRNGWFTQLMVHLSHNAPLDVAVAKSLAMDPERIIFASASALEEMRLSRTAVRMLERTAAARPDLYLDLSDRVAGMVNLGPGLQSASLVSEALKGRVKELRFDQESGDATGLAEMARVFEETAASTAPTRPEAPRFLQAQVLRVPEYRSADAPPWRGTYSRVADTFWPGVVHYVDVRIAAPDAEWLGSDELAAFPDYLLSRDWPEHELRVVFSEPLHLDRPQTATIRLPASGSSTPCRFTFMPREEHPQVEARIAVLHDNRVLQTALLRGSVTLQLPALGAERGIELVPEAMVHPYLGGLEERSHFHAALIVNRNEDGARRMLGAAGSAVGVMELEGIDDALKQIRARLSSTPPSRMGPTRKPFTDDNVELLRFMAYQGRALYDGLVADQFSRLLAAAARIQIVSAKAESFLPLEFVYDRASPAQDARMCPNAVEAARTGQCPTCPSLEHDAASPWICPAGFWALTRVIERHAFDKDDRPAPGIQYEVDIPAPTAERKVLQPLRCALYAASDKVEAAGKKKKLVKRVLDRLSRAVQGSGGTATLATSWAEWQKEVKARKPTLLMVLSHTVRNKQLGGVGLEIAAGDCLLAGNIAPAYVAPEEDPPAPEKVSPVVLLLGCETSAPEIPYQGFVPNLRRAGAAVVVCTSSTVLGREVGPAAEQLVDILEKLTRRPEPVALGDALLELRRDCLARGMPMALGLVAYGDADWRIAP